MIRTFADDETETIWNGKRSRKLPPDIQDRALVRLRILNRAETLDDPRNPPSRRESFWRERSAGVGLACAAATMLLGALFTLPYLLRASIRAEGDVRRLLLGARA